MTSCLCFCSVQTDAWFELISVVMDMAIWHTKHAAVIAASDRWATCCHRNSNQLYSYHFLSFHISYPPISHPLPSHFTSLTLPFHIPYPPISHPSPSHFTLPFHLPISPSHFTLLFHIPHPPISHLSSSHSVSHWTKQRTCTEA